MKDVKFLRETGLLFEINRRVLHPLGLALVIKMHDDGSMSFDQELMETTDAEGIIFEDDRFKSGEERLETYMRLEGDVKLIARKKALGYVEQKSTDE